jgi:hypothetical protein
MDDGKLCSYQFGVRSFQLAAVFWAAAVQDSRSAAAQNSHKKFIQWSQVKVSHLPNNKAAAAASVASLNDCALIIHKKWGKDRIRDICSCYVILSNMHFSDSTHKLIHITNTSLTNKNTSSAILTNISHKIR